MYQIIRIDGRLAYVPLVSGKNESYLFNSSTYFIRAYSGDGHYSMTRSFYSQLGNLEVEGKIRHLRLFYAAGGCGLDMVFVFDAPDSLEVMKLFVRINDECVKGKVKPLPDLEFVHPAAHALLYSLGKFSGDYADSYLLADPGAVDLNQKVL